MEETTKITESKIQEVLDTLIDVHWHTSASPKNVANDSGFQGLSEKDAEGILNTLVQRGRMEKTSDNRYRIINNEDNRNRGNEMIAKRCYEDKTKSFLYPVLCKGCKIIPQCNKVNNLNQPVSG